MVQRHVSPSQQQQQQQQLSGLWAAGMNSLHVVKPNARR
jgi:hypothetical protein